MNLLSKVRTILLLTGVLLVSGLEAGSYSFGKQCQVNNDCKDGLVCDVRGTPITYSCLNPIDRQCYNDLDCVNSLSCVKGRCGCKNGEYYDDIHHDCIAKQTFGEPCNKYTCADGLVCSYSYGPLLCKLDFGETCSQDDDCTNFQFCINGRCGCYNEEQRHEPARHDCSLIRIKGEGEYCHKTKDCKNGLACDSTRNGGHSNICKRGLDKFCHYDSDCANGLKCNQHDNHCVCDKNQYYDDIIGDCVSEKQFTEPCIENRECAHGLVCDLRVQPTPLSYNRYKTCLKSYGMTCRNNSECVNYLPCNDGVCGCRPNYYYNEDLFDCFPRQPFGHFCEQHQQCQSDLACDNSLSGAQSWNCLLLPGARCSEYSDCANSLDCIAGFCSCHMNHVFNYDTYECENMEWKIRRGEALLPDRSRISNGTAIAPELAPEQPIPL